MRDALSATRSARGAARALPLVILLALAFVAAGGAAAGPIVAGGDATGGYRLPPPEIVALIDAPPTPLVSLDPSRQWLLVLRQASLPPLSEVAQPELRLAGLRFNPCTSCPTRAPYFVGLSLRRVSDGREVPVTGLPPDPRIRWVTWSPDGRALAFTLARDAGVELWTADVASGRARAVIGPRLNAIVGQPYDWLADSRTVLARLVPEDRGAPPAAPPLPAGPVIQETAGRQAAAPTYQDLLRDPHDADLLEYHLLAQAALVGIDGTVTPVGRPALLVAATPSPDDRWLLLESVHRPFSYLVPLDFFPRRAEVVDRAGNVARQVADLPLAEEIPIGQDAVRTGPRELEWRADAPATLAWVEALDGGDPRREATARDRLLLLAAPFTGEPTALATLGQRFDRIRWGGPRVALVSESWHKTRRARTWIVDPSTPGAAPAPLFDRSSEDRYGDPGAPLMAPTATGTSVLLTASGGRAIFLAGDGASPEGDQPFLDRLDLRGRKATRLWRSAAPRYERVIDLLATDPPRALTRRESPTEPPNYFVRDLRRGEPRALTTFPHPQPQLIGVSKQLIHYQRADGVALSGTLYLPPGYDAARDGRLPLLMWAYPQEYKSAAAAGQVSDSPYRFVRATWSSPVTWVLEGYAVLDNPSLPVIGEGGAEPNDTYVEQLVAGAKAAVDAVVSLGVADPGRIAVGGHSYGAFMTANLLAHTDLFRAGLARSGAYNRTLTPFGFQNEERTLWQAPQAYLAMSPFLHADTIKAPLLMIHGEADNNSGTFPLQSERLFNAIQGNGGTARLVMLPFESHGYRARESIMHVMWETWRWLQMYVKNAPPRAAEPTAAPRRE